MLSQFLHLFYLPPLSSSDSVWPDGQIMFQYLAICNKVKWNKFAKVGSQHFAK